MITPEYNAWVNMRQRCLNPNHPEYESYGGRGIEICAEWESYRRFRLDMGPRPSTTHSLDRIDNDAGYSPNNCCWDTKSTQSFNQRVSADNSSGVTGVYMERQTLRWKAYIRVKGKQITLGRFSDFFEAVCARKSAENIYYKELKERAKN